MINNDLDFSEMSSVQQLIYAGTRELLFNKKKFLDNLKLHSAIDDEPIIYNAIKNIFLKKKPVSLDNYYNLFKYSSYPYFNYKLFRIVKSIISEKPLSLKLSENVIDSKFNQPFFIHGNLHIAGDFEIITSLFITGNLTVTGVLTIHNTSFFVGGNIEALAISTNTALFCLENIKANYVIVEDHGRIEFLKGLCINTLIEVNNGEVLHYSPIIKGISAYKDPGTEEYEEHWTTSLKDEMKNGIIKIQNHIDFVHNPETAIRKISALFNKELSNLIENEWEESGELDFYFNKNLLLDFIKKTSLKIRSK